MALAIYKVMLQGSYHGQAIVNNLAYRVGVGIDVAGLAVGGAQALAECVKDQIWPKMKPCVTSGYKLETIQVNPIHGETLEVMYQNPWTIPVMETGSQNDETNGAGPCVIYKFNLEPTMILANGIKPPKRGYIALGPIHESWIDNDGRVADSLFINPASTLNQFAAALAGNLESLIPPVVYFPIRVKQEKVLNVWKVTSWADVGGCLPRNRTSFRRSRMTE